MPENEYLVSWEIDVTAETAQAAAEQARKAMLPPTDALVFHVHQEGHDKVTIDLAELPPDSRVHRAQRLAREYKAEMPETVYMWAGVARDCGDVGFIVGASTFEECCEMLGSEVLDGCIPLGVFNLDTGEMIELHISTPVVSRSEDQGIMRNPLTEDEQGNLL